VKKPSSIKSKLRKYIQNIQRVKPQRIAINNLLRKKSNSIRIKRIKYLSCNVAELANASIVRPRDQGLNLGIYRKYFAYSVCVAFEFSCVGC
jgi:hypothetical protein